MTGDVTLDYVAVVADFASVGWEFFNSNASPTASAGGAASNLACAAADLGLSTGLLSSVGIDVMGDLVVGQLTSRGVDCTLLTRVAGVPTGVILIAVDSRAERHTVAFRGANLIPLECRAKANLSDCAPCRSWAHRSRRLERIPRCLS